MEDTKTTHPIEQPFHPFNDGTGYTAFFYSNSHVPFRHYSVSLQAAELDAKETIANGMADEAVIHRNSDWSQMRVMYTCPNCGSFIDGSTDDSVIQCEECNYWVPAGSNHDDLIEDKPSSAFLSLLSMQSKPVS